MLGQHLDAEAQTCELQLREEIREIEIAIAQVKDLNTAVSRSFQYLRNERKVFERALKQEKEKKARLEAKAKEKEEATKAVETMKAKAAGVAPAKSSVGEGAYIWDLDLSTATGFPKHMYPDFTKFSCDPSLPFVAPKFEAAREFLDSRSRRLQLTAYKGGFPHSKMAKSKGRASDTLKEPLMLTAMKGALPPQPFEIMEAPGELQIFGLAPTYKRAGTASWQLGTLTVHLEGTVLHLCISASDAITSYKGANPNTEISFERLLKFLKHMSQQTFNKTHWYHHIAVKGDLLHIPTGFITIVKVLKGDCAYGFKLMSFSFGGPPECWKSEAWSSYNQLLQVLKSDGVAKEATDFMAGIVKKAVAKQDATTLALERPSDAAAGQDPEQAAVAAGQDPEQEALDGDQLSLNEILRLCNEDMAQEQNEMKRIKGELEKTCKTVAKVEDKARLAQESHETSQGQCGALVGRIGEIKKALEDDDKGIGVLDTDRKVLEAQIAHCGEELQIARDNVRMTGQSHMIIKNELVAAVDALNIVKTAEHTQCEKIAALQKTIAETEAKLQHCPQERTDKDKKNNKDKKDKKEGEEKQDKKEKKEKKEKKQKKEKKEDRRQHNCLLQGPLTVSHTLTHSLTTSFEYKNVVIYARTHIYIYIYK